MGLELDDAVLRGEDDFALLDDLAHMQRGDRAVEVADVRVAPHADHLAGELAHRHVAAFDQVLFTGLAPRRSLQRADARLGVVAGDGVLGVGIQRGRRHAWILQMGLDHGNRLDVLFGQ